jgi:tripartite ATP-independent transporter DctM subunit
MIIGGIILSHKESRKREKFNGKEILSAFLDALPEFLLPVFILVLFLVGVFPGEIAAWSSVYAFIVVIVRREMSLRTFRQIGVKSLLIVGGVLIILAVARGLNDYLINMSVPEMLITWLTATIQSPLVFLLLLNLLLLVVGCFMDLYSAILVVVPLLVPIAKNYGIADEHLALIFLSNLGVGFLTPPVGMNLFLSAFRFERPLVKIYRDIVPFLLIQIAVVLMITYFPYLWQLISA